MRCLILIAALLTVSCGDVDFPTAPTRPVPSFYRPDPPLTGQEEVIDNRQPATPCVPRRGFTCG